MKKNIFSLSQSIQQKMKNIIAQILLAAVATMIGCKLEKVAVL